MIRDKRNGKRSWPMWQRFLFPGTAALVGLTLLFFQNCQANYLLKVAQLASTSASSEAATADVPLGSPFADGKLQVSWSQLLADSDFRNRNHGAFATSSDSIFSLGQTLPLGLGDPMPDEADILVDENQAVFMAGQNMTVLIDTNCRGARQDTTTFSADLEAASHGTPSLDVEAHSFQFPDSMPVSSFRNWLEDDPCIIGASEEVLASTTAVALNDDPRFAEQSHLEAIHIVKAQELFFASSLKIDRDVVIAIVDTGVDTDHSDLTNHMWTNNQGQFGYDYVNGDSNPNDDHGHGTHCAGLAAAQSNNGIGVSGVMGFNSKIMALKVLAANGSGTSTQVVNGINYATNNRNIY